MAPSECVTVVVLGLVALGSIAACVISSVVVVRALRQVATQRPYWLVPQRPDKQVEVPFHMPPAETSRQQVKAPTRFPPSAHEEPLDRPDDDFPTITRRP